MKTMRGILLFELLPVAVVVAGAAMAYHLYGQRMALREAENQLNSAAHLAAELIHREISPLSETLRSLMMQEAVGNYLHAERTQRQERFDQARQEIERSLERTISQNPRIELIELYAAGGEPIAFAAMSCEERHAEASQQSWFAATLEQQRFFGYEGEDRIRLATITSRSDRFGPPVIATLVYNFRSAASQAAQLATRHLNEVQVLVDTPLGPPQRIYGELQAAGAALQATVPLGDWGSSLTVRQSRVAALAAFHQATRVLWFPLAAVTLGLLLVAALGTQKITRDIREAQRRTEEANAAKGEFLANMSHEIRTPMNGILGMLELLQTARLRPQEREYVDMARESADSLLRLLNDILDFSKIEAGRLELEEAPFDFRELVEGTLQTLALRAAVKGLRLSVHIDDAVPRALVGDAGRLRQILVNLVGNAIKFTQEGDIQIAARQAMGVEFDAGGGTGQPAAARDGEEPLATRIPPSPLFCLHMSVCDTGIGISADKQQLIFDAFRQADPSTSRRFGGTGLGLAIASKLVGLMRGKLWLESEPGQGSTFQFVLSLAVAAEQQPANTKSPPLRCGRAGDVLRPPRRLGNILLAEDALISQKVATRLLQRRGHSVVVVENGEQALEALRHNHFDLVLMDVEMPELDGIQATRAIRDWEHQTGRRIPVIAMTAHALKGDRERFLAAGMDDYLSKPVVSRTLYEVVERNLESAQPAEVRQLAAQ